MTSTIRGDDGFNSTEYNNFKSNYAGKNAIIDGNFDVWLEGTSQTITGYGSDTMWHNRFSQSTAVHSRQSFALGQTAVPGNPKYFSRTVATSVANAASEVRKFQNVESVLTYAGETVTLSFWFNTDAPRNIAIEFAQDFGTGGSPSAPVTGIGSQFIAVTPGWKRYTATINIPSVTGKTLGTNNNSYLHVCFWFDAGSTYAARAANLGQQSGTFDIAQVQLEKGSVATEFERLTFSETLYFVGRYYQLLYGAVSGVGWAGHSLSFASVLNPEMRQAGIYKQIENDSSFPQTNIASTLSQTLIKHNLVFLYRNAGIIHAWCQFSELFSLDARL